MAEKPSVYEYAIHARRASKFLTTMIAMSELDGAGKTDASQKMTAQCKTWLKSLGEIKSGFSAKDETLHNTKTIDPSAVKQNETDFAGKLGAVFQDMIKSKPAMVQAVKDMGATRNNAASIGRDKADAVLAMFERLTKGTNMNGAESSLGELDKYGSVGLMENLADANKREINGAGRDKNHYMNGFGNVDVARMDLFQDFAQVRTAEQESIDRATAMHQSGRNPRIGGGLTPAPAGSKTTLTPQQIVAAQAKRRV